MKAGRPESPELRWGASPALTRGSVMAKPGPIHLRRLWMSSMVLCLIGALEIVVLAYAGRRPIILVAVLPLVGVAWYAWRRFQALTGDPAGSG